MKQIYDKMSCQGITKKNNRCKNKATIDGYCRLHVPINNKPVIVNKIVNVINQSNSNNITLTPEQILLKVAKILDDTAGGGPMTMIKSNNFIYSELKKINLLINEEEIKLRCPNDDEFVIDFTNQGYLNEILNVQNPNRFRNFIKQLIKHDEEFTKELLINICEEIKKRSHIVLRSINTDKLIELLNSY